MSDELNGKPPIWYYVLAGIFFLWNLVGLILYYGQVTMTPEIMEQNFTAAQVALMNDTPIWATSAYAIAVNAGVVAALLLFMRKAWAFHFFVLSLAAALVQDLDAFILRDVFDAWGNDALVVPVIVIVVGSIEIWYSRSVANRYYR
jgi:hypothetical protein